MEKTIEMNGTLLHLASKLDRVQEEIEEDDMKEFFAEYGTITDIVRMKDKETGNVGQRDR